MTTGIANSKTLLKPIARVHHHRHAIRRSPGQVGNGSGKPAGYILKENLFELRQMLKGLRGSQHRED
jgi:hypothetical protein